MRVIRKRSENASRKCDNMQGKEYKILIKTDVSNISQAANKLNRN